MNRFGATRKSLAVLASAATSIGAAALLAGCGEATEETDEDPAVSSPTVSCTPGPVPDRLSLDARLVEGGRIPFTYAIESDDSQEESENFTDSIEGEFAIGAESGGKREIEWRLPDRGFAFALAGASSPDEIEDEAVMEDLSGELAVPIEVEDDGRISRDIDVRAITTAIKEALKPLLARIQEGDLTGVTPEQATLLGQALGAKLVEKPFLALYPYGYALDPDRVLTRERRAFSATGPLELTEEVEVLEAEDEDGCVVVEIRDVYDPDEVEALIGEVGEVFGTFDPDDASGLELDSSTLLRYDAGAGLIRQAEQVREVTSDGRTRRIVDRYVISDPVAP